MRVTQQFFGMHHSKHDPNKTKKLACARCGKRTKHAASTALVNMWGCTQQFSWDGHEPSWKTAPAYVDSYCGVVRLAGGNNFK